MNQFIFDELTGLPTILATNRINRPIETQSIAPQTPNACLFCKGSENLTPGAVYQDSDDWNVRVFPNKFPIIGDHEILVHSPSHEDIEDLPADQNIKIIRAYLNRVHYFNSQEKEVMIFNNRGGNAGASIIHPHSQIIALKGFPGTIEQEKEKALTYYNEKNSCFWCDEVKNEIEQKSRVIFETPHYVLLTPKASRWSYEMQLVPKEHRPNFEFINEVEINDLARVMKAALGAYNKLFNRPDRNFWLHTMRFEPYHWHMGLIAHIPGKVLGGLELGAGIWVSDRATPEEAASALGKIVSEIYLLNDFK
ncbi:MAG TPA: DUF4931 domain-containing protein [Candidatus Saccharimonadales bacterium]|nr:DUF4931 domain-containing protein [Candidatus Saccharimonadales bacterium]